MAFPRVDVYNAYSGSTALVQYIGSAQDLVAISGIVSPIGVLFLADAKLNQLRTQSLASLRDIIFSTGNVTAITVTGRLQIQANSNGVANWIIWTGGFSAGSLLLVDVEKVT
jgi:phage protein U